MTTAVHFGQSSQEHGPAQGMSSSQAPKGSFWSRHKVTILTVTGAVVGGAVATALIATGVGASLIALPIIAKFAWAAASGMLIGGLGGLGLGLVISDLRKVAVDQAVLAEDFLQSPQFHETEEEFTVRLDEPPIVVEHETFLSEDQGLDFEIPKNPTEQEYRMSRPKKTRLINKLPYNEQGSKSGESVDQPALPSSSAVSQNSDLDAAKVFAEAMPNMSKEKLDRTVKELARGLSFDGFLPTPQQIDAQDAREEREKQNESLAKESIRRPKKRTESPVEKEENLVADAPIRASDHPDGWLFQDLPVQKTPVVVGSESTPPPASPSVKPELSQGDKLALALRERQRDEQGVPAKDDEGTKMAGVRGWFIGNQFAPTIEGWENKPSAKDNKFNSSALPVSTASEPERRELPARESTQVSVAPKAFKPNLFKNFMF
ncbi:MAG TPA: hypothetical protein VGO47_00595 [Chlamydiales bacterium]|jgi:hypothetical protein|nr:hypothetical protein [Chlamydiales bacterium]